MALIIINGAPGAGKTTLVRKLAKDLQVGYITKDQLKELLGDTLGMPDDPNVKAVYGEAAIAALFAIISKIVQVDKDFIVENAFWADIANKRFAEIAPSASFIQIYLSCEDAVLRQRFEKRISDGKRHGVHGDSLYTTLTPNERINRYRPLELSGIRTIMIDTTNFTDSDYQALVHKVQKSIRRNNEASN